MHEHDPPLTPLNKLTLIVISMLQPAVDSGGMENEVATDICGEVLLSLDGLPNDQQQDVLDLIRKCLDS